MPWVITRLCADCQDTACVKVCPVDCIPLNPDYEETEEELMEKYQRLTGKAA